MCKTSWHFVVGTHTHNQCMPLWVFALVTGDCFFERARKTSPISFGKLWMLANECIHSWLVTWGRTPSHSKYNRLQVRLSRWGEICRSPPSSDTMEGGPRIFIPDPRSRIRILEEIFQQRKNDRLESRYVRFDPRNRSGSRSTSRYFFIYDLTSDSQ